MISGLSEINLVGSSAISFTSLKIGIPGKFLLSTL
jgi:hypothetical protein